MSTEPRRRGRPPTGQALSSTQRSRLRRERLADLASATGGRQLQAVVLTGDAAAALERLRAGGMSVDQAVCEALIAAAATLPLPTA